MIEMLLQGFTTIINPSSIFYLTFGVLFGTLMGAIPGLTSAMAVALMIPLTFGMDPVVSIAMLLGSYKGGCFGGSISAILIGTPGTPAAAATVADGYALAKQGKSLKALKMALVASVFGDSCSDIVLILVAAQLARVALQFGPPEFTILIVFALTMVAAASQGNVIKGIISSILGMLIALIGLDPITARTRLAFGVSGLTSGIELIPMLVGLMAVSEVLVQVKDRKSAAIKLHVPPPKNLSDSSLSWLEIKSNLRHMLNSTIVGTIVGIIPGLGPTVGSYMGYGLAEKTSKNPEEFGKGSLAGIAAAESGNNAVSGANMIPLLGLGVPGDVLAAIIVGAFLLQGIAPGPRIFVERPDVVYGIYAALLLCNVLLFVIMWPLLKYLTKMAQIKVSVIFPAILIFCSVGAYAFNQTSFDMLLMVLFGIIGYFLRKFEFPLSTLIIGFILGPMFEENFRRSILISDGQINIFFQSPVCLLMWALTLISLYFFSIRPYFRQRKIETKGGVKAV